MTEVWHAREAKQQEFVRELAEKVWDAADESGNYDEFVICFLIAVLKRLRIQAKGSGKVDADEAGKLFYEMRERIFRFSRVKSEELALTHRLFSEVERSIASWMERDYLRDQIIKPQEVFGAPSAMSEVKDG